MGLITVLLVVVAFACMVFYLVVDALATIERQQQQKEKTDPVVIAKPVQVQMQRTNNIAKGYKEAVGFFKVSFKFIGMYVLFILLVWAAVYSLVNPGVIVLALIIGFILNRFGIDESYAFIACFIIALLSMAERADLF